MRIIYKCFANPYIHVSEVKEQFKKENENNFIQKYILGDHIQNLNFPGDYDYSCGKFPEAYASMILFSVLPVLNSRGAEVLSIK